LVCLTHSIDSIDLGCKSNRNHFTNIDNNTFIFKKTPFYRGMLVNYTTKTKTTQEFHILKIYKISQTRDIYLDLGGILEICDRYTYLLIDLPKHNKLGS